MHTMRLGRSHGVWDANQHHSSRFVVQTVNEFTEIFVFSNDNPSIPVGFLENDFIVGAR